MRILAFLCTCVAVGLSSAAHLPAQGVFNPVSAFTLDSNPLVIERSARQNQPFSVVGERGAILGQQDGTFELWSLPVKVLRDVHLTAHLQDYGAVINLNDYASSIEVRPDHTTIVYSHAAITVRQHMFLPRNEAPGVGSAIVLFEIHATRAAELTVSFTPSMERQWPAPNHGRPGGGWIARGSGGAYSLETDDPSLFGMVAMPKAAPGPLRPYQERPRTEPLEFHLAYQPGQDDHVFYPLLTAVSDGKHLGPSARMDLLDRLLHQAERIPELYQQTSDFYNHFFDTRLTMTTPDRRFNDALRWAEISIQQSRVTTANGAGLAGGWFTSGDSDRPGFGWFFGRDTLWTLYAVNSYGDFALSRDAMNFLLAHQRADGKMMHEYSQTAADVDWEHLPYLYAAADSTPLFVMEMDDYVRASGDLAYLRERWDAVKRAYAFTRSHTTNSVYDNTQGTGWVEEWLPTLPHQELYLAALDQQSAESISRLARLLNDDALSASAAKTSAEIKRKLEDYRTPDGTYAFSRRADGSYENVASIFPSVAWWSGRLSLPNADATFQAWAGSRFATDWGPRSVSSDASIYDPVSYHHGSVWPLYTGWLAMADYRSGRPLQGFANLFVDAQLTWLQDPGAITEVLSGEFFEPLGRSSSHQLWSSAMLLSPTIRGLAGIESDALNRTLIINPQLPADWNEASLEHVSVGDRMFDVHMKRVGRRLEIDVFSKSPSILCLTQHAGTEPCESKAETNHQTYIELPAVEVSVRHQPPVEGERTSSLKVVDQQRGDHDLTLVLEAPAGTVQHLNVRRNDSSVRMQATGGVLQGDDLSVTFDQAPGGEYKRTNVSLHW